MQKMELLKEARWRVQKPTDGIEANQRRGDFSNKWMFEHGGLKEILMGWISDIVRTHVWQFATLSWIRGYIKK